MPLPPAGRWRLPRAARDPQRPRRDRPTTVRKPARRRPARPPRAGRGGRPRRQVQGPSRQASGAAVSRACTGWPWSTWPPTRPPPARPSWAGCGPPCAATTPIPGGMPVVLATFHAAKGLEWEVGVPCRARARAAAHRPRRDARSPRRGASAPLRGSHAGPTRAPRQLGPAPHVRLAEAHPLAVALPGGHGGGDAATWPRAARATGWRTYLDDGRAKLRRHGGRGRRRRPAWTGRRQRRSCGPGGPADVAVPHRPGHRRACLRPVPRHHAGGDGRGQAPQPHRPAGAPRAWGQVKAERYGDDLLAVVALSAPSAPVG